MKKIALTKGKFTLVDDEDFDRLNQFKWHAAGCSHSEVIYAARRTSSKNGKYVVLMHRVIMGLDAIDKRLNTDTHCDHISRDSLDNQKANLRLCSQAENVCNRPSDRNAASKYKGVSYHKSNKKFRARISVGGKSKGLKYFKDEIEAAKCYDLWALKYHGEFAYLNFPKDAI